MGGRRTLRGTETKLGPLLQQMGTELLRAHGGTRRGWGYTEAQEQYIMLQHDGARHREPTRPRRERAALAISRDGPQRWMLTAGLTM